MTIYPDEASRQLELAGQLREAATAAERRARNFTTGDEGERDIAELLLPLAAAGWTVWHKRRWPGTRSADLDHVLIGPPGVIVLDSKNWGGAISFRRGRLYRDQADESDAIQGIFDQIAAVTDLLHPLHLAPAAVTGALVFLRAPVAPCALGRAHALDSTRLLEWLTALGHRLSPDQVREVSEFLAEVLPPAVPRQTPARAILQRKPKPRLVVPQDALFDVAELDLAEMARVKALGLEEWMTYLHPSQLEAVKRRYTGPSRVRGPAGCGKTVVALHRAAFLAGTSDGPVLVTSYVRTLPDVLRNLYTRLSPATASRFCFTGVHRLAMDLLHEAGVSVPLNPKKADACWKAAWSELGQRTLETPVLRENYWHEEVFAVIKGRGLDRFDDYAELARVGRRTPLQAAQRRAVWDLYINYQQRLEAAGHWDFADVIDRAAQLAEDETIRQYRFVIVDEAQDLTLRAMVLLNALVSHEADGLTLVGDGQQAIYPGGFTMREAGIALAGRSTVLNVNYRNAAEVLERARDVVRLDEFDDLEDLSESGDRSITVARPGGKVLQVTAPTRRDCADRLIDRLSEDARNGYELANAAVLCHSRHDVASLRKAIERRGIATIDLEKYDGTPVRALKVGTTKRAKGLEFERVYVPYTSDYLLDPAGHERERVERERRELFVAMTRARDGLWLALVAPSPN